VNTADLPHIRPARVEDEPAVVALMRDFYAEEHLVFDELATPRAVHELLACPALGSIHLFTHAGSVVGYFALTCGFSLEFHGRYALLDELYLIPPARGRGGGRHALDVAAETARAAGVAALRLEVGQANLRVRSTYLKSGYQDDRRDLFTRRLRTLTPSQTASTTPSGSCAPSAPPRS
jgi:GNAT superfamily N-acetyltransferase